MSGSPLALGLMVAVTAVAVSAAWGRTRPTLARRRMRASRQLLLPRRRPRAAGGLVAAAATTTERIVSSAVVRRLSARWSVRRYDVGLAMGLEAVARQLRTGAALPDAVAAAGRSTAGPAGHDLRRLGERARLVGLRAGVAAWVAHRPVRSVRVAAAVLSVGFETGGASARGLDATAGTLRERAAVVAETRSLTAQARLSAGVLGAAPLLFALVVSAIDPHVGSFLLATPSGLGLLAAGLALDLVAIVWMRRLVASVVT